MLFNSLEFALFLPVIFILYWIAGSKKNTKTQNAILLIASYLFYACWDFRFLILLLFSTVLDFFTGLKMQNSCNNKIRKYWFLTSVIINLGFLGIFKYYNFFIDSLASILISFGITPSIHTLNIILPVGISFYTFHGLSYVIDIYKKRIPAEQNFIDYGLFVSYFPLLVAGPIERATHLLPQLKQKRNFNYSDGIHGVQQILWGLFKKIVVADNCATIVNQIFERHNHLSAATLIAGAILFAFQIYGDFSGYSDIAIGSSRLFGIHLIRNFNNPYFSRDIAEFWRRWHISLTTWFRDYIYIPLGGSRVSTKRIVRNTFIIFIISGIWHGANYTFIAWGVYHSLLFLPLILSKNNRKNMEVVAQNKPLPSLKELTQISITFLFVTFGWIIFRSENIGIAREYLSGIFNGKLPFFDISFFLTSASGISLYTNTIAVISIFIMIIAEWHFRDRKYGLAIDTKNTFFRLFVLLVLCVTIYICHGNPATFIYFQF